MNKQRIIGLTVSMLLGMILTMPSVNAASHPVKAADSGRFKKQELSCPQIQEKIRNKEDVRGLVRTNIEMGYDAPDVIKCSVKGGGDLPQVICGALEAGTSKDVVSDSCIEAGADSREVYAILKDILEVGLCDVLHEELLIIESPPGGSRGGFLSPSGF